MYAYPKINKNESNIAYFIPMCQPYIFNDFGTFYPGYDSIIENILL
jgi:hypothetical protein